jgi:hypothetical protein
VGPSYLLLALMEPEDHQRVFIDGLLMSPGSKKYKVPTRPETLQKLREFLDDSLRLNSSPSLPLKRADNGHYGPHPNVERQLRPAVAEFWLR